LHNYALYAAPWPAGGAVTDHEGRGAELFGDLLARARQQWIRQMSLDLADRGFTDYRRSDALAMRILRHGPVSLGELSQRLGVSRQVARQVADGLLKRRYAVMSRAEGDRRRVEVHLTPVGTRYAEEVVAVITSLNRQICRAVDDAMLESARAVLQRVIDIGDHSA
jgi:DNA-binding MarR family transcriptional regulator